ncbi:Uncharacterized protein Adt_45073 [Abeliophyllum distichum]|uniref:Uncharacterized protein n=1 Tax=Abeliophyllum distichum TaxID=126358 RepID=A0ABD1PCP2_9LAMI
MTENQPEKGVIRSPRWGYFRIITGTILGGILGFYLMHRAELKYKEMWDERLKRYEEELNKKKNEESSNEVQDAQKSCSSFKLALERILLGYTNGELQSLGLIRISAAAHSRGILDRWEFFSELIDYSL